MPKKLLPRGKHEPIASSKYKGVNYYKNKKSNQWRARIKIFRKEIHIGYYDSEIEAALAYNIKAVELFGEFAVLNRIENHLTIAESQRQG